MNNRLIYLDYAATTPVLPEVSANMIQCIHFEDTFGNPASSTHHYGYEAAQKVAFARQQIAQSIHVKAEDIVWTSGATESNNLAIKGIAQNYLEQKPHIITSQIEHKAVLDTCHELERLGCEVTYLAPSHDGIITPEQVEIAIQPNTILVSLMLINNELGSITDIAEIAQITSQKNILLHVDAAQAPGKLVIDVEKLKVDLMSFSGHKVYAPKGIGALYVSDRAKPILKAQIHGGGHEYGFRSGTLATHQIVAMGTAFELATQKIHTEQIRLNHLRTLLWNGLKDFTEISLNGSEQFRVSNYLNVCFLAENAGNIVTNISQIAAVSASSACNSKFAQSSHVLKAIGRSDQQAQHSIRFSLGVYTTQTDIERLLRELSILNTSNYVMRF